MRGLKSLILSSIVTGALVLPFSQQAKASEKLPPPAHYGIEEIVEYDPSRGCDVGLMHSQSRGHRPQGVRLSDDDVMTQTISLQCKYFQIVTSKNQVGGSKQDSDSYLVQVAPLVKSDDTGFIRIFAGFGKTNYSDSKHDVEQMNMGFQSKGFPKEFPLDIKFLVDSNFVHHSEWQGNSEYLVLTAGHDFKMGNEFKIPVIFGIERYNILIEKEREIQNEVFTDIGLKYVIQEGFAAGLNHRMYLNEKPLTRVNFTWFANF